ncbi:CHAP domain-containing protein [Propioniciclava tarda]|uniref:CHAP domain-containing protein n=1 Tax=Propioniciclava tarda TaxID=433330 RepID=A0A4Q9KMT1_PROTD|nr:CHAP domain-containing protein [Propioniciclava tarda]TBT95069.1 CHAP domain-containing protein [Propioniciclava tarda]SMO55294.1 CHAP domain-containing protein [Propioniciclava tarda]HOA89422.1 DUF2272 domain-containing protein [Propioniciclava tarda]HQA31555.1 DUF2272 domain-containing protein [Propioniciclava tarda]HQD60193.1 DUF2272 domain-containing protein [Propioniciclava tarda]
MRRLRLLAWAASAALTAGCAVPSLLSSPSPSAGTPTPTATPTTFTVTVASGTATLKVRHIPATTGNELGQIPPGASVIVDCRAKGTLVSGTQGSTATWDYLTYNGAAGYIAAAFVEGGDAARIPACPYSATAAPTPLPLPAGTPSAADVGAIAAAIASSQLGVAETPTNCNPYSKVCEAWCGHFATWVWQQAGVKIPDYGFTGDIYAWGKKKGKAHPGTAGVGVGDVVLYGTGPGSVKSSTHVDIVVAVFPDHLRVIGGNVDDRVTERNVPLTGIYGWVGIR